ncbi:serine hydrolase domain-containing protein [Acidobacteriota bacterium]
MKESFLKTTTAADYCRFNLSFRLCQIAVLLFISTCMSFNPCSAYDIKNSQLEQKYNFEQVKAFIPIIMKRNNLPSLSVAVAKNSQIIWEEAFGLANREKKIKATPHTMYSLASISKPITATGLMVLVERGLIDLNQPINVYLEGSPLQAFEGNTQEATVKRILQHTSGLPQHWQFFFDGDSYKRPSMTETIRRFGILVFPPGERHEYSNLGYGIVEYIIERISKKSFSEFMESEVFEPLGLKETAIFTESPKSDLTASRYIENKDSSPFYDFDHRGASAVYSSAPDLVRFGMFHLKNHLSEMEQILSDRTIDLMQTAVDTKLPNNHYKLGWDVGERYGYKVVSHGGGMPGVRTILLLLPSENIVVAILCNGVYINLSQIYDPILSVLIPKYRERRRAPQKSTASRNSDISSLPSELIGEWIGEITTYNKNIPVKMFIQQDGSARILFLDESNNKKMTGNPISLLRFSNGCLEGSFDTIIPIEETGRFRSSMYLKMKFDSRKLSGYASAVSLREIASLPSYIRLSKKLENN